MALTSAQRALVREYLGWSARFHDYDRRLENALDALAGLPADEARVVAILAELADIDTRLADARDRLQAAAVGSITLNAGEVIQLRNEGTRHVRVLANTLGVEVHNGGKYGAALGGYLQG